ncbi:hypothetical protein ABLB69_14610 [Xenorhabdus khoisanae]|uniref:hypothetical protein n=1 Tax=Xenorhabdus khoisanae TaxID=880157 RepID=UPI0032B81EFE
MENFPAMNNQNHQYRLQLTNSSSFQITNINSEGMNMTTPMRFSIECRELVSYNRLMAKHYGRGSEGYVAYTKLAWRNRQRSREWAEIANGIEPNNNYRDVEFYFENRQTMYDAGYALVEYNDKYLWITDSENFLTCGCGGKGLSSNKIRELIEVLKNKGLMPECVICDNKEFIYPKY